MTKKDIQNPHDQFFRTTMADIRVAREFLKVHLPTDIAALVDFNDLTLQPRSQANAVRSESIVDVLFKTKVAGHEAYFYLLLEHQSTPDPLMAFRMIQYTVNVIDAHLKEHKTTKIPLLYPLVVYHGKKRASFSTNINDLVDAPRDLVDNYFLKPFQLLDLNQIEDDVIKQHIWSGAVEFALKHIYERDMLECFPAITPVLKIIYQQGGRDLVGIVLQYMVDRGEFSNDREFLELINENISHDVGEQVMSLAQKWKEQGEHQSLIKTAQRMLAAGSDPVFVMKVTTLTMDEVKNIQNNMNNKI